MLADVLVPSPDLGVADALEDHLTGLRRLEGVADQVEVLVPGHGSVGAAGEVRRRTALDRAHVHALQDGRLPDDPRLGPSATFGHDWLPDLTARQLQQVTGRTSGDGTSGP